MKIGFLFPGQGSQVTGMGKDLYEKYDEIKNIYDKANELTGIDIADISFNNPDNKLNETKYTQICILTMCLGILEILKKNNIDAEISAGLSLGEYTALAYSNLLNKEDAIKIIEKRGTFMQDFAPSGDWSMAAVLGLENEKVEQACKEITEGFVVPVNFNCTGQVVISGETEAVTKAGEIAKELGAKKVRVLNTAGPFHTEKLSKSASLLKKELDKIDFGEFTSKVIKNIDGEFYTESDNYAEILEKHIISPVRFSKTLELMLNNGIDTFVEIGPGKTLSGFVRRMNTDKEINILNINDVDTLEKTINFVKENENG